MIEIKKLFVSVWNKEILKNISTTFEKWKKYLIIWKNWSWKSSLINSIMWNPQYNIISWEINLNKWWKVINVLSIDVDEKSREWIFSSFQNVPEIEGIKLWEFLRIIYNIHLKNNNPEIKDVSPFVFRRYIKNFLEDLKIQEDFLDRDLNVWFSGWEKRKIEILQMLLINSSYIFLDEIDSWLDIDSFDTIMNVLKKYYTPEKSLIIISHQFKIIDYINFDKVILMKDWEIVEEWSIELIEKIWKKWFEIN